MGYVYPFKGPSSTSMTWSDNYIFNPNSVNIYLPRIISYLPLAESSTWKFHVTIVFALCSGKVKSILTFRLVVILPASVFYCITESYLGLIFVISLIITIIELHALSDNTKNKSLYLTCIDKSTWDRAIMAIYILRASISIQYVM